MKKKFFLWAGAILFVLIFLIIRDMEKIKKEEKPPLPEVMIGDQSIPPAFNSFSWYNGNSLKTKSDPKRTLVDPFHDLVVTFPESEKPDSLTIKSLEEQPFFRAMLPTTAESDTLILPSYPGNMSFLISAKWKDKGEATYSVSITIDKEWSYQEWLSPVPDQYLLIMLGAPLDMMPPHIQHGLYSWENIGGDLELFQRDYPELEISSFPTYLLFDQKSVVMKTDSTEKILEFLTSKIGSKYIQWLSYSEEQLSILVVTSRLEELPEIYRKYNTYEMVGIIQGESNTEHLKYFYPELYGEEMPLFMFYVFNHEDLIFQTSEEEELQLFIKNWKP